MTPPSAALRVGLLGLGTVGGAVAGLLVDPRWRRNVEARGIPAPELVAVGVREPDRPRPVGLPDSVDRTADLASLVERDDVDVVIELLGGLEPAGSLVLAALARGRPVITANKALLATRGEELESCARDAGASLRFEASVGGGIPLLGPLVRDLAANDVKAVRGILNGTTNYILSAMASEARAYEDVLVDAQRRGYAEADPTADVDGHDAAHKLVVLARLAFGAWLPLTHVRREGITSVSAETVTQAAAQGRAVKLVAAAQLSTRGGIEASVAPAHVPRETPLGSTDGVTNIVEVEADPVGRVWFRGPGAGGSATASAVLGDLLAIGRGERSSWEFLPPAQGAR